MKRILFISSLIVVAFLVISILVLPEYRWKIFFVLLTYLVVLGVVLKLTMSEYLNGAYNVIFSRRTKFISIWALPFLVLTFICSLIINNNFLSKTKLDYSSAHILSLSSGTTDYLRHLNSDVEVIYIRPTSGGDEKNLFNSILGEFANYTDRVDYRSVHPVINSMEYNDIKKALPTVTPGSVVAISENKFATTGKVSEYDIISTIYRARTGERGFCISKGHGEPSLTDFSEQGSAIITAILKDRGIILVPVDMAQINSCKSFIVFEPKTEFSDQEIRNLLEYKGDLIILGGAQLKSLSKFISQNGINVLEKVNPDFSRSALREFDGGLMIDRFSEHPIVSTINGSVVVSSAYEITCNDCYKLAGVSSSEKDTKTVLASLGKLQVFAGGGLISNFFMRFRGNAELVLNMISFSVSQDYPFSQSTIKGTGPQLFAISPKYLNIIFVLVVIAFPLIILLLSVYCFKQDRG